MNFDQMIPDALAVEYKRDYGYATGELKLSDIVNHPSIASEFRRLGLGLPEESLRLVLGNFSTIRDNDPHSFLVSGNSA